MKVKLPVLPKTLADFCSVQPSMVIDEIEAYARLAVEQAVAAERARWEAEVAALKAKLRERRGVGSGAFGEG